MGLIRAILNAGDSVLRDQWREYFACDSLSNDILVAKGEFHTTKRGLFGANNRASRDVITNGSIITVSEGQIALIVDNGKIVEFCAEPGAFKWENSSEPSLFCGSFTDGLIDSFKRVGYRFTFGGDLGSQQRVYYVNTKQIMDNKFGTATAMPYDDPYYKTALYIRYYGQYVFQITDPIVFFSQIAGNVADVYTRDQLKSVCTDEFTTALDSALSSCAAEGIKFSQLPREQRKLAAYMSDTLDAEWHTNRGIKVVSVAITKVTPDEDSRRRIEEFDTNVMHSDPAAMTGGLAYAQMEAMRNAASNSAGAMTGFMGFGMAANAMGGAQGQGTLLQNANAIAEQKQAEVRKAEADPAKGENTCACGTVFTGKFCPECGTPARPAGEWKCPACGNACSGKFCSACGTKRPEGYRCACGYESPTPFKFCPECGKKLGE